MQDIVSFITERQLGQGWKEITKNGYKVQYLAFDEPSQYGIDKGKISKLWIKKGSKVVCNYDRGWDIKPEDPTDKAFYDEIIKKFN